MTEPITIKILKVTSKMVCQWKIFNDSGVLYIIRKVLKNAFPWNFFQKQWLKLYHQNLKLTLKLGIVQKKFLFNIGLLHIIKKVLKNAIQWVFFWKRWLKLLPSKPKNPETNLRLSVLTIFLSLTNYTARTSTYFYLCECV